jgi:hypothetical protein
MRAVRKALKDQREAEMAAAATASGSDGDEPVVPQRMAQKKPVSFAALAAPADGTSSDEAEDEDADASTVAVAKKKNKKKAKKKKAVVAAVATTAVAVEEQLASLGLEQPQSSSAAAAAVDPMPVASDCTVRTRLLVCEPKCFDADAEMKRMFGAGVIKGDQAAGGSRPRRERRPLTGGGRAGAAGAAAAFRRNAHSVLVRKGVDWPRIEPDLMMIEVAAPSPVSATAGMAVTFVDDRSHGRWFAFQRYRFKKQKQTVVARLRMCASC